MLAGLLLAYAAQTAGLGPDHPIRHEYFQQRFMVAHGGAVGEGLYWASTTLFERLGAHILVVLLFVSGGLLLTGTTLAACCPRDRKALRQAGTGPRRGAHGAGAAHGRDGRPVGGGAATQITISRERETETFETERLAAEVGDEAETIAHP